MIRSSWTLVVIVCSSVSLISSTTCPIHSISYFGIPGEEICYWMETTSTGGQIGIQNRCTATAGLPAEIPDAGANDFVYQYFQSHAPFYIGVKRYSSTTFVYWNEFWLTYNQWASGQGPTATGDCVSFNNKFWAVGTCYNGFQVLCSLRKPVIVDGGWSDWEPWSACSVSCGLGIRIRTRLCDNPVPNGGSDCFGGTMMTGKCLVDNAPQSRYIDRDFVRRVAGYGSKATPVWIGIVRSRIECASECTKHGPTCVSYDYDLGNGICEINSDMSLSNNIAPVTVNVSYWESTDSC